MSGRPRHNEQQTSQDQYRLWRPTDRQVESDSERPRYKTPYTSQSRREQPDGRYHSTSRGYTSDSPATASSSQHRSGTTSSKTLHHPARPSVSGYNLPRSQQAVDSTSTTPVPPVSQSQHHSRSQPQRSQPETQDPRVYSHRRNISTPTPQSSYERVNSADEFGRAPRANTYSRGTAPVPQTTPAPDMWIPTSQDSSSRRHKDKENDRLKDRDKERNRDKPKDSSERRRDREGEREEDAYGEAFREAFRSRDKAKDREKQERRAERELERDAYREPRSSSRAPTTRDGQDLRMREPAVSSSGHRRYRSEDGPASSSTTRRPHLDSRQPSSEAAPPHAPSNSKHVTHPSSAQPTTSMTPHGMPVYLPGKQPSHKASQEKTVLVSANTAPKMTSTSDNEQPSRRENFRANDHSRLANLTPTPRDYATTNSDFPAGDREPYSQAAPFKSKIEAKYQAMRAKFSSAQPPPTPVLKPSDIGASQTHTNADYAAPSLSVLPTVNRSLASAKPQFVSIRAGQGPSDPQAVEALQKSTKATRDSRPEVSPEKVSVTQSSSTLVRDRIRKYEASIRPEGSVPAPPALTNNVEPNQSQAGSAQQQSTYQSVDTVPSSNDRIQIHETKPEVTAPLPSRVYKAKSDGNNRSELTPKPALSQYTNVPASSRPATSRTVRFDLPSPPDSPEPTDVVPTPMEQISVTTSNHLRPVEGSAKELRSPPPPVPLVPSSSSGSREALTPPSPEPPKLSSSLHTKDRSPLQSHKVTEQRSSVIPSHTPLATLHPPGFSSEPSSSPYTAPQASPARSGPSQMENSESTGRTTVTAAAPPTAASSQSQPLSAATRQANVSQSTPSQSTSRSTKASDTLPADRVPRQGHTQPNIISQQTTDIANAAETILSNIISKPSTIEPAPHSQIRASGRDGRSSKKKRSAQPQTAADEAALDVSRPAGRSKKDVYDPSVLERQTEARAYPDELFAARTAPHAAVATKLQDTTLTVSQNEITPASHGHAHEKSLYQSSSDNPMHKSVEGRVGRQKAHFYTHAPQPSFEEFAPLNNDSNDVPIPVPLRKPTSSSQAIIRDDLAGTDKQDMPPSRQANAIHSTVNPTSNADASHPPAIHSSRLQDPVTFEEPLLTKAVPELHRKKQDPKAVPDISEDTVLLRGQLHEGRSQPLPSAVSGKDRTRPDQHSTVDPISRTAPPKSWYQNAKHAEVPSPRLQAATGLPHISAASIQKSEFIPTTNSQALPLRTAPQAGKSANQGPSVTAGTLSNLHPTQPATSSTVSSSRHDDMRYTTTANATSSRLPERSQTKEDADPSNSALQSNHGTVPPKSSDRQQVETISPDVRAPVGTFSPAQNVQLRFPVVEDASQRPGPGPNSRPERVKFSYAPSATTALDQRAGLLSPLQQAIRAPPTPQVHSQTLSHDIHHNFGSRAQTVPPVTLHQPNPFRLQATPKPTPDTPPQSSTNPTPMIHTHNTNPYNASRPDETIAATRTISSSAYPSSTYPSALYHSESHPAYPQVLNNVQQSRSSNLEFADKPQPPSRHIPPVQLTHPPQALESRTNLLSRSGETGQRPPVISSQAYPIPPTSVSAPTPSLHPASAPASTSTNFRNVSLTNQQSNPPSMPSSAPPLKTFNSNTNPPHPTVPSTPIGSVYHLQPDRQQTNISTRVSASSQPHTQAHSRPQFHHQLSRTASNESILMTPSSLAPSMLPRTPSYSRTPSMPPVTRQESKDSRDSSKKKNSFFSGMFRSKTPTQKAHEVWHPPTSDRPKEANHSQSSLQSTNKTPTLPSSSGARNINVAPPASQRKVPMPIAVDIPLHAPGRKDPDQKVFSAFKFLHTKRTRTMSRASLEAQDGQTQTATNTVVGSPTQSALSQTPGPFIPPPLRDPVIAAHEWRNKEEADARGRAKERRRRPGVTFDMDQDEPPPGTVPSKKKLSRRR